MSPDTSEPEIAIGQTWERKGDTFAQIRVTDVDATYVYVARNTSRRRQAISRATLLRKYDRVSPR